MKALLKSRPAPDGEWPVGLRLEERPAPLIEHPEEILVRVVAAGVCGTDVGIYKSRKSLRSMVSRAARDEIVIGHEFCGVPEAAGPQARRRLAEIVDFLSGHDPETRAFTRGRAADDLADDPGFIDFVAENFLCSAEMHITCGWCHQCLRGERYACRNTVIKGVHADGAFAERLVVPASNLLLFRRGELPAEIIAFMDALGNAVHTVQAVGVMGKSIAITGCGVQGLMATAVARRSGATRIYVTDFTPPSSGKGADHTERTRFAMARRFGANDCFDLARPGEGERLRDTALAETDGSGVDAVLEMSGSYNAYRDGLDIVRMGGTMALLGIPEGEMAIDFASDVIVRGLTVRGIIGRRVFDTWEVMRNLLRSGLADELLAAGFVSHQLALEDYETGIAAIIDREATKVILKP